MGRIINAYIFPHPPLIVPEIGQGNEKAAENTITAVKKAAENIGGDKPATIIVTTPHGPVFQDFIYISDQNPLSGTFGRFDHPEVKLEAENNLSLARKIANYAEEEGIPAGSIHEGILKKYGQSKELDHGVLVPLYFIEKELKNFKLVHISVAGLPPLELYAFGQCIAKAVEDSDEDVVFLASGDMSHRLSKDAPYGYHPKAREFDELLVKSFRSLDVGTLLRMDEDLCESAGECGLRSFIMMFGALDGLDVKPEVYSYEGPYGVGYSIARFVVGGKNPDRHLLEKIRDEDHKAMQAIRDGEDEYVKLARASLESYVLDGKIIPVPEELPREMSANKAGAFVSIKKQGQLRGCIGTTAPTRKNIAEEIIYNAISAGTQDPRFNPIEEEELDQLVFSVDILAEPEPIHSMEELDVVKYGVIVRSGRRSGLLLPNLEGVEKPEQQVGISLQKAGIDPGEKYSMERFEVVRHK